MPPTYLERLAARSAAVGSVLCLGLDPDPSALPEGFSADLRGVEAFARLILEAAGPYAAAVKPNLAFFEAFGAAGLAALERLRAAIPDDLPVVADAKRGDIGSTAARQAVALFDRLGADAVTASPYLGAEAIAPLLERTDRFAYVLCRTSNPGAGELQDLIVAADPASDAPAEPLWARVARRAADWGPGGDGRPRRRRDGSGRDGRDPGARPGPGDPRAGRRRAGRRGRAGPRSWPGSAPAGRRAAREAASSSTSRAGSPARRPRPRARPARRTDPGERLAEAAASWAGQASCAIVARLERRLGWAIATAITRGIAGDAADRSARADHRPGHRAARPRPGRCRMSERRSARASASSGRPPRTCRRPPRST